MPELDTLNTVETSSNEWNLTNWVALIDRQLREKNFKRARESILQGLTFFPDKPALLDRLFIIDQRWNMPLSSGRVHLCIPNEDDFSFLQQCYENASFMEQLLPMGRRKQSPASLLQALRDNEFSVAQSKTMHWIIKKEVKPIEPPSSSPVKLKPVGLASLIDIQIAHRRAELLVGFPEVDGRNKVSAIVMLLIFDFAFNQIGLHKLISTVLANNQHSQRSTTAIGFSQEGLRRQHLRDPKTRKWLDCYENGLVEDSFRANPVIARLSKRLLGRDITQ